MNKISLVLVLLVFVAVSFTVGYKVGDAHGYNEGYDVGYLYDCKDELKLLHNKAESLGRSVSDAQRELVHLRRSNDSLSKPGVYDTIHARFSRDSLKYHKLARRMNDSLRALTHQGKSGIKYIINDDGTLNFAACALDPRVNKLRECRGDWKFPGRE